MACQPEEASEELKNAEEPSGLSGLTWVLAEQDAITFFQNLLLFPPFPLCPTRPFSFRKGHVRPRPHNSYHLV